MNNTKRGDFNEYRPIEYGKAKISRYYYNY